MEKEAETKKEFIEYLADLRQQPADVKKSRSETKNFQQVLQASETRYRRLFETAQDGILILNAETGEIDDVNPYMIDMLHYSREEFLGMKLWEVSPFKDTVLNRAAFEQLQDKGYIRYKDLPLETKEGKPVAVEFVSNVYKANGNKVIQCNIRNITDRKQAEEALRESEGLLHTLVQTIPDLIWLKNKDGVYLSCNIMFERFFGAKEADIVGKTDYDFVDRELADSFCEHDREAMAAGKPTSKEDWIIFADDGHRAFVDTIKTPMYDVQGTLIGVLGIGRDITDRNRADEELTQSEEKYRSIFENAQEGIFRTTPDGKIIMSNPAMAKMFGYESPEEMMTSVTDVDRQHHVNPEDRRKLVEMIEEHGFIKGYEAQNNRKDGSIIWISLTMHAVRDEKGQIIYYDGIIEDITNRKQAEERIHASLREKEILLGEVHHRVKNNMQVISGLLDLQASSSGNPELTGMLNESQRRIRSMALVHEKLYGSKDFARIDMAGYLRTLSQDLFQSHKINPGKIDLIIQTDGVYVDINKAIPCGLILNELISNAIKHAFPGDRQGELQIIIREEKNTEIEIVVRDNGLSLPDNVDIHQPRTVGLHLVNGLVKNQLDGQMEVRRDNGTEFRIKFPL
jgi:PAS domain S-box-containing protein